MFGMSEGIHDYVNSGEWLRHRAAQGHAITAEDVARIITARPDTVPDGILRAYVLEALRGELKGAAGRPARTTVHELKLHLAAHQVDVLIRWYRRAKERGYDYASNPGRERLGLSEYVHEHVARRLKLGSGRSLANHLSSLKRRPY
jgi:hypothetical protein